MTDKDLKKLNRRDLLILLADQTERADNLEEKLRKTEKELEEQQISINESGTIAEAALKISGIFQAADAAVATYVENIKQLNDRQTTVCQDMEEISKRKAEKIVQDAEKEAAVIIQDAKDLAAKEIEKMNAHWDEIQRKIREMDKINAHWDEIQRKIKEMDQEGSCFRGESRQSSGEQ